MNNFNGWFNFSQGNLIQRIEYDGNQQAIYIGWAAPGSSESDLKWRIVQNTWTGGLFTSSAFPNGSPAFAHSWTARAGYTYT